MFGLVVPKRPLHTSFVQEGETRWTTDIPSPHSIAEFVIFLMRALPSDSLGVGVYWSFPPFSSWEFIGVLTNSQPSELFDTGWALNPEVRGVPVVRLGLSVEEAGPLLEKLQTKPPLDTKREFAQKVALNLYRFIESFNQGMSDVIQCPQDVLDRWYRRFESRAAVDPLFVMRTE
ncbi:unnamed protein product [Vitrella brassicaformis CCMP3155]|uniref:Uncharacterized protein n=2 Tax=Vitrella brassicaformis TaxID=1169539 RepID=A0A0G4FBV8_VITBC|nr:unnamed protein product [Vitrella brassicaformis CCMP3155]|mmetsp:Transcript_26564/g.66031  ORF Transcript_26564/g.66031 Transcript_26564/m.66031 type:complete len:175 (+) Transcript_26564:59-583(+)|eukprot:CEM10702.1 unnamed protein product [Vitrella brassicaformis CCMP3155]